MLCFDCFQRYRAHRITDSLLASKAGMFFSRALKMENLDPLGLAGGREAVAEVKELRWAEGGLAVCYPSLPQSIISFVQK